MSLGQLALHVATVPGNVAELAAEDTMPEPPAFVQPEAASAVGARADARGKRRAGQDARSAVSTTRGWGRRGGCRAAARSSWPCRASAVVRTIMLNHWYHHRGQLLVYLRLLDQSVPSVYGPTADENPFRRAAPAA